MDKTVTLGKIEGSRERGRLSMVWIESIKKVGMSLQLMSRSVEDKTLWTSLITGSSGAGADSVASNTILCCGALSCALLDI